MTSRRLTWEEIKAASDRYPDIPQPMAVAKFLMDDMTEGGTTGDLQPGMGWGGVHLERVGALVQKLVDTMYHQAKKSITLKIIAPDAPDSYDHLEVSVELVDDVDAETWQSTMLASWPCCACDRKIGEVPGQPTTVLLDMEMPWEVPTWGNILSVGAHKGIALLCTECAQQRKEPAYAIKKDGEEYVRVPLADIK